MELDEELSRLARELAKERNINRQTFIKRMIERLKAHFNARRKRTA